MKSVINYISFSIFVLNLLVVSTPVLGSEISSAAIPHNNQSGLCTDKVYSRENNLFAEFIKENGYSYWQTKDDVLIRTIRHKTAYYKCDSSNDCATINTTRSGELSFNEAFYLQRLKEDWIGVFKNSDKNDLIWIHKKDLLCNQNALDGEEGVYKRLFIYTKPEQNGKIESVIAFDNPETTVCLQGGENCNRLVRFKNFYVVARDNESGNYLLKSSPDFDHKSIGWLKFSEGLEWESALGLHPSKDINWVYQPVYSFDKKDVMDYRRKPGIKHRDLWNKVEKIDATNGLTLTKLIEKIGEESLDDLQLNDFLRKNIEPFIDKTLDTLSIHDDNFFLNKYKLVKWNWYQYEERIAILNKKFYEGRLYYHVAAPGIHFKSQIVKLKNSTKKQSVSMGEKKISVNHVDVFFLIDGTQSMSANKERAISIATLIANRFSKLSKNQVKRSLRLGFRIFHDYYSGRDNCSIKPATPYESKKLLLKGSCSSPQDTSQQLENFIESINETPIVPDPDCDGYKEALFWALQEAINKDMKSCPENNKVLFVVGDHGDHQKNIPSELVNALVRNDKPIVPIFIQTPDQTKSPLFGNNIKDKLKRQKKIKAYREAYYDHFQQTAKNIRNRICVAKPGLCEKGEKEWADLHFICLGERESCDADQSVFKSRQLYQNSKNTKNTAPIVELAYGAVHSISDNWLIQKTVKTAQSLNITINEAIEKVKNETSADVEFRFTEKIIKRLKSYFEIKYPEDRKKQVHIINSLYTEADNKRKQYPRTFYSKNSLIKTIKSVAEKAGLDKTLYIQKIIETAQKIERVPPFFSFSLLRNLCKDKKGACKIPREYKPEFDTRVIEGFIPAEEVIITDKAIGQIDSQNITSDEFLNALKKLKEKTPFFQHENDFLTALTLLFPKGPGFREFDLVNQFLKNPYREEVLIGAYKMDKYMTVLDDLTNVRSKKRFKNDAIGMIMLTFGVLSDTSLKSKERILNYVKKANVLPVREDSPLMQYTPTEIQEMEPCERDKLRKWIETSYELLGSIKSNSEKIVQWAVYPSDYSNCRAVHPKKRIPFREIKRSIPMPDAGNGASYMKKVGPRTLYWIPKDILP